jgi:hypothetical protein
MHPECMQRMHPECENTLRLVFTPCLKLRFEMHMRVYPENSAHPFPHVRKFYVSMYLPKWTAFVLLHNRRDVWDVRM